MITIKAEMRDVKVSPNQIRSEGKIPAVVYGKGVASTAVSVDAREFELAYKEIGTSTVFTLAADKNYSVLVHEIARHPVTDIVRHIDFLAVPMDKEVEVSMPIHFNGEAPAAKAGTIAKVLHSLTVKGLPANLPHEISVDMTKLTDVGSHILVKDIVLPKGVVAVEAADEIVASAGAAHEEAEPVTSIDMSAIGSSAPKGKKEEDAA
jgi:large subunit ribosomal protein L25